MRSLSHRSTKIFTVEDAHRIVKILNADQSPENHMRYEVKENINGNGKAIIRIYNEIGFLYNWTH